MTSIVHGTGNKTAMEKAKQPGNFFIAIGMDHHTNQGRIPTIDTMRGISVILIFHIHFATAWHAADWSALSRFIFYTTDFVGPMLFVVMSILGSMISLEARANLRGKSSLSRRTLLRVSFLFLCGESINIETLWRLGWYSLTSWNIVLAIGVFTLILPAFLKIRPLVRVAIAACIALTYFPLVTLAMVPMAGSQININTIQAANLANPATLPYWLFFYHDMMTPIFSWMIIPLLVPVIFKGFVKAIVGGNSNRYSYEIKRIAVVGLILVLAGVVTGFWRIPDYVAANHVQLTTPDAFLTWPFSDGEPLFLIRHTPQYMIYSLGMMCLFFSIIAYIQLPRGKKLPFQGAIVSLGSMSLTGFYLSMLAFLIPLSFSLPVFYLVAIPFIALITLGFHAWYTKGHEIASLEWLMHLHVSVLSYYLERHQMTKQNRSTTPSV